MVGCSHVNVDTDKPVDIVVVRDLLQLLKFIVHISAHVLFEGELLEVEDIWKFEARIYLVIC